ncbi:MAG: amidohydrolase family protein [Anaerolineae bacterium]|nr:amidohydrolase family protein [Anaerolineae bacterium]
MLADYDCLVTGGQLVTGRGVFSGTLAIRQGKIAAILDAAERPPAAKIIEADGLHLLPGLIDTHVHIRDPGQPDREDFTSGTSAAAAGGVTTILEMPISEPPVNSGAILRRRAEFLQPKAIVDFALYGAAGAENIDQIAGQAEAGAGAVLALNVTSLPTEV